MELSYLKSSQEIDAFLLAASAAGAEFLPSAAWLRITRQEKEEAVVLGAREGGEILALATFIKKSLGRSTGHYWYSPRGPVFKALPADKAKAIRDLFAAEIKKLDRQAIFWRLEPNRPAGPLGPDFRRTIDLQPARTLMLPLQPETGELLKSMGQKTRYNIRLAEKKGVRIVPGKQEDWPEFWRLMKLTSGRDAFRLHDPGHYQNLFKALAGSAGFLRLFFAEYGGRKIATGLFCFFGGRATYLHGASDDRDRRVMAPYLLQWEVMKQAKTEGLAYYDFYGIDEKKWPGVTRFKKGFGGEEKEYPGTFDLVFRPGLYNAYMALRRCRRWLKI